MQQPERYFGDLHRSPGHHVDGGSLAEILVRRSATNRWLRLRIAELQGNLCTACSARACVWASSSAGGQYRAPPFDGCRSRGISPREAIEDYTSIVPDVEASAGAWLGAGLDQLPGASVKGGSFQDKCLGRGKPQA